MSVLAEKVKQKELEASVKWINKGGINDAAHALNRSHFASLIKERRKVIKDFQTWRHLNDFGFGPTGYLGEMLLDTGALRRM